MIYDTQALKELDNHDTHLLKQKNAQALNGLDNHDTHLLSRQLHSTTSLNNLEVNTPLHTTSHLFTL